VFIYSIIEAEPFRLQRLHLLTGEQSSVRVPVYQFKVNSCLSELPGGYLLFTGGETYPSTTREVVRIDTLREFAVSHQQPMLTPRHYHSAVYHALYLYVFGGFNAAYCLSKCERYECTIRRWEPLPPLPTACGEMSAVEAKGSLYALGGSNGEGFLDIIQRLRVKSLTWELMSVKLPHADYAFPCFKVDSQIYLVMKQTLYSFLPLYRVKQLPHSIDCFCSSSYYSRGTLYCSHHWGKLNRFEIGWLS
jgi:hypothetical protein